MLSQFLLVYHTDTVDQVWGSVLSRAFLGKVVEGRLVFGGQLANVEGHHRLLTCVGGWGIPVKCRVINSGLKHLYSGMFHTCTYVFP